MAVSGVDNLMELICLGLSVMVQYCRVLIVFTASPPSSAPLISTYTVTKNFKNTKYFKDSDDMIKNEADLSAK